MVKKSTKFFSAILAILGGVALIFALFYFRIFWNFDTQLQDKLFIKEDISSKIVIVAIDDDSIQQFGQWPWNREMHAEMIEKLENSGARAIGYDVTFSEKGNGDEIFLQTLNNYDNVVFPMEGQIKLRQNKIPQFTDTLFPIGDIRFNHNIGHSVLIPDVDGKIRKVPFYIRYNDEQISPFYAEILRAAGFWAEEKETNPKIYDFNQYGLFRIKFFGPQDTFKTYSFSDVLENDFKSRKLKDKIVLVGATANNLHDEYFTASTRGQAMSGVEIQANLIESYLQKDFLREIDNDIQYLLHLAMLAIIIGLIVFSIRIRYSVFLLLLLMIVYLIFCSALFASGFIIPILYPILLMIVIYFLGIFAKYLLESKEKKKIRAGFSQYVAKEVVDELIARPEKLNLGGEKKTLSILFSDIRGFTSLSEKLSTENLVELLNDYLSAMSDVIIENDGVIDKYIGDAIMAFWNAPLENKNHEKDAIRSALMMVEKLKVFNKKNRSNGKPEINIGIGINTGKVIVGNIGSKKRFDYTVIGDDVNLASRLEGLTKYYGVQIIVSAITAEKIKDEFVVRYLDNVAVKGKDKGVKIYEVLGVKVRSGKHEQFASEFNRAARIYLQGRFKEAKYVFEKLKNKYPEDKVIDLYLQRIRKYLQNPPRDFDGVFQAEFK